MQKLVSRSKCNGAFQWKIIGQCKCDICLTTQKIEFMLGSKPLGIIERTTSPASGNIYYALTLRKPGDKYVKLLKHFHDEFEAELHFLKFALEIWHVTYEPPTA
jgi:hypothetical protein